MMNFETYYELLNLYAQYSLICDSDKWDEWPEFFTDDCVYSLQPRENYERGMPLGLLDLESKEMLVDRVYGTIIGRRICQVQICHLIQGSAEG